MRAPRIAPAFGSWTMSDGYVVRGRVWPPPRPGARVGVLYLHGIQSHGGWFEHSASLLNERGAAVLLPDRRGSGMNAAARGDVPGVDRWLDDLDALADGFAAQFALERVAVLGVSWGGKLALAWLLRRPARVAHALLVAPGVRAAVDVGLVARARIVSALLFRPAARFRVPLDDPALFTGNPAGQAFIRDDALKLTEVTARFLYHSSRLDARLRGAPREAVRAVTTVMLAGRERIIDNDGTRARIQHLVARPATFHHFAGAAHTLEFESDPGSYFAAVAAWLTEIAGNPIQPEGCNTRIRC